ncbi:hypothetical protein TNCV_1571871 [Trichonephila clavipes]|uniref:Uncharacterized protein n=1 Tax=Trichonephila clavipes TaxID=2585209 RepID=A0A8X6SNG6_TRICX|nr:hypothetical protein TNCV_1571871 [Trichonephila clavipes]
MQPYAHPHVHAHNLTPAGVAEVSFTKERYRLESDRGYCASTLSLMGGRRNGRRLGQGRAQRPEPTTCGDNQTRI